MVASNPDGARAVLALVACGDDDDGDDTDPTTSPEEATNPTATGDASSPAAGESVTFSSEVFELPVTMNAVGLWTYGDDVVDAFFIVHDDEDSGPAGYLGVITPKTVYAADGLTKEPVPADLASWLKSHPRLIVEDEQPATVGGLSGVQLDVRSDEEGDWNLFDVAFGPLEVRYNDRVRFIVLDGPSGQVVISTGADQPSLFDNFIPLAEPVVESIEFTS